MADGIKLGGAYYELTADDSKLLQTLARTQSQAKSFGETVARSMGVASGSTDQAMKQMAASTKQAESGFGNLAKSATAFGVAVIGIGSAAEIARKALESIVEQTQKANQAQFALNATFKQSADTYTQFANAQAAATKRTVSEVQEAIVAFGSLSNRYAITSDQVKELTKRSADLAAVHGITTVEAAKRLEAALRGEAESAEFLGLTLNSDYLKKFADMTAEQRKNFETLDPLIKAQIIYREVLKQTNDQLGQAEKHAADAAGATQNLETQLKNLSVTLGKYSNPALEAGAGLLAEWVKALDDFLNSERMDRLERAARIMAAIATLNPQAIADALMTNAPDPRSQPGAGPVFGPSPTEVSDAQKEQQRADAENRERKKRELDAADTANKAMLDSALKALEAEKRAKEQWYDEERQRIEARRTYQLADIETRKRAALDALATEKQATLDAIDDQIEQQERLKQSRLDAAEAAADAARAALAAQKQQLDISRELEDRARGDARAAEDRTLEDARRTADRSREKSQQDEIRGLEALTDARKKAVEEGIAALEKATEKRIRALDRESDRARANGEKALTRIERQGEAEDEAHRKRMQALDDERDARLEILDAQLRALDTEEKAATAARRTADLQQRILAATQAQTRARGTGTPQQVADAREELTRAIKGGDELSIANARERLVQLAGQGNEAIKKADEDLAAAQQDLRDEGVSEAHDAEREKLKAAQDAIKDEIDARKRAEDDADRARKQDLELSQEHERSKLKATLDRIDAQKQAVQDSSKNAEQGLRQDLKAATEAADEQVRITRARFAAEGQALEDARRDEDRLREDTRQAEDRTRADARREQDADLQRQLAAVSSTLEAERKETEAHYNGPNGIITQLKAAREQSEREYSARLAAVTRAYEAERKAAELLYTNPEGTGELQLLEKQRAAEIQALADRKTEYEEQAKAFHQMIVDMIADLDAFIAKQQSVPKPGGGTGSPGSDARAAGSGKATSASTTTTRSGKSGKEVQGTLGTWLNDAMDIAGVGDDWANGLFELARLESGGDPHNRNDSGASGLMQMMPSTFKGYRDKHLPDDIFDPVANAVASIRYIQQEYLTGNKTGSPVDINWIVANHKRRGGYDAGGMITEPVIGRGLRSGRSYAIGEYGPEYILGRRATSALLGGGAGSASMGIGGFLASAHPGAGSGGYVDSSSVNFYGLTYEQAEVRQRSAQRRRALLKGAGRVT